MARARNIKPGFFENEDLAELPVAARLLFIGLWTQADREGRLEDRPKRIKMQVLPMDDLDVDELLQMLHEAGFIYRYGESTRQVRCKHQCEYIQVLKFDKHQSPHCKEKESTIPAPDKHGASSGEAEKGQCDAPPDSLIVDSLNDDSLNGEGAPKDAPPKPKPKATKGCTIPDGFPGEDELQWARDNEPSVDAKREALKFRNHWLAKTGKDATKKDWRRTWQNWVMRAAEWGGNQGGIPGESPSQKAAREAREWRNKHIGDSQ